LSTRDLDLCFRPCLRAHIICYFNQFHTFYPSFFHIFSWKKIHVTITRMLFMDDTLDEDVLMIFGELGVQMDR